MTAVHTMPWYRRTVALAMAFALVASGGCDTMKSAIGGPSAPPADETPAQRQLREDAEAYNKVLLGGMLTGAAVGAGIGVLTCLFKRDDQGRCAVQRGIAGAVIGGVAGAADGYMTAKKQQATREKIREIDLVTADVRRDNETLDAFVKASDRSLAESRATANRLRADLNARRISTEQARSEHARIEHQAKLMQETLENMKKSRTVYAQTAAKAGATPVEKRNFDAEIRKLDREIAALERNVTAMNTVLSVSRV